MCDSIVQKFLALRGVIPAPDPKKDKKNKKMNKDMNLENIINDTPPIQQIIEEKPKNKIVIQYIQARLDELNNLELNE
jgi:hypothetical protein